MNARHAPPEHAIVAWMRAAPPDSPARHLRPLELVSSRMYLWLFAPPDGVPILLSIEGRSGGDVTELEDWLRDWQDATRDYSGSLKMSGRLTWTLEGGVVLSDLAEVREYDPRLTRGIPLLHDWYRGVRVSWSRDEGDEVAPAAPGSAPLENALDDTLRPAGTAADPEPL